MSPKSITAHYVCSTHWDREWYQSFQGFRFRLVAMMDELLDHMRKNPDFRYFQTDGQCILIEDYLEIRPEREPLIRELAQAGRLRIGPWYTMPDEFLPSGESLIRNLQLGLQTAARFGPPARIGFICDMFGHNSQLPQILRGFGIDNAQLFRGIHEDEHGGLFRWQAADGSEVLAYRFHRSYGQYGCWVRNIHKVDQPFDIDHALEGLARLVEQERKRCPTSSILLFDGSDHLEIEPRTTELLRLAAQRFEDVEFIHSHMEGFIEDLREQREKITHIHQGEMRYPCPPADECYLLAGVLSSRMPLKQANARCENELLLWAEPFAAFADLLGKPYPHQYLHVAWKHLLTNHPHDSICGCSIDQVHKDMVFRFDQSLQIARLVADDAIRHIARQVSRPSMNEKDFTVVVFNPSALPVDGPVDLTLRFPADIEETFFEGFGYEHKISFRLADADGREIPYQLLAQRMNRPFFKRRPRKMPQPVNRHEIDVCLPLRIPPYGYTTLIVRPVAKGVPTRYVGSMRVDDHTMENEFLRVRVQSNGTLALTDKRNNQTYENLLTFEDGADIGDGWFFGRPANDQVYSSIAAAAETAFVADGIAKCTLKITVNMNLPRAYDFSRHTRAEETSPLRITSYVTLRRGADRVEIETVVENTIRDHRLRVLMPTGTQAQTYFADGAFDVVERSIALTASDGNYIELEEETKPQYTWTAVFDAQPNGRGLAVISTGLPESAVGDRPDRPLALTLFRAFRNTVFTAGEEGGQIQGTLSFRYSIMPLQDSLPRTALCRIGQQLAAPPRSVQLDADDNDIPPPADLLPPVYSFMPTPPETAVITALQRQRDDNALILRMFNPEDEAIVETIELCEPGNAAEQIDFEGQSKSALNFADGCVEIPLGPKQIVTVRIR